MEVAQLQNSDLFFFCCCWATFELFSAVLLDIFWYATRCRCSSSFSTFLVHAIPLYILINVPSFQALNEIPRPDAPYWLAATLWPSATRINCTYITQALWRDCFFHTAWPWTQRDFVHSKRRQLPNERASPGTFVLLHFVLFNNEVRILRMARIYCLYGRNNSYVCSIDEETFGNTLYCNIEKLGW